jgi:hypothetical protein
LGNLIQSVTIKTWKKLFRDLPEALYSTLALGV